MPIVAPEETCYTFSMEKKGALGALREKRCNMRHVLTSEAVTRGHPDKLCDQVADGVLDALLTEDPEARAACEAAVWENHLLLFGEISARQEPDYEAVAREVLRDMAMTAPDWAWMRITVTFRSAFIRSHRISFRASATARRRIPAPGIRGS